MGCRLCKSDIYPGEILLFIDEIQEYPQAIKALRYFMKDILIFISLLEFVGDFEEIPIPVGRIQNFYMNPMSFGEFLPAAGEDRLREYLI